VVASEKLWPTGLEGGISSLLLLPIQGLVPLAHSETVDQVNLSC
jgi:hypothetical protein